MTKPTKPVTAPEERYTPVEPVTAPEETPEQFEQRVAELRETWAHEHDRTCPACGETFSQRRIDQIACSGKCRVRLHRQRRK
jgi:hypothetical protein